MGAASLSATWSPLTHTGDPCQALTAAIGDGTPVHGPAGLPLETPGLATYRGGWRCGALDMGNAACFRGPFGSMKTWHDTGIGPPYS
jgi:hypothetical protein